MSDIEHDQPGHQPGCTHYGQGCWLGCDKLQRATARIYQDQSILCDCGRVNATVTKKFLHDEVQLAAAMIGITFTTDSVYALITSAAAWRD